GNGAGHQTIAPNVIGGDDVIGKARRHALDGEKNLERQRIARAVELADVKLRHDVVNIENDFGAAELGEECRKDLEVRNRVNMDEVVFFFEMAARQEGHRAQEKHHQPRNVGELALFVDLAGLDTIDANAVEDFESGQAFATERNGFDRIAALGQGFSVSPDAIVGFVE